MYVDYVSGTVNWGKLMFNHPEFAAGHTNRQIAERWRQLRHELPAINELEDNQVRNKAVKHASGWLLR